MEVPRAYDGTLQMFVEEPRKPDLRHLEFLRWLAERGRLEHDAVSPPRGEYAILKLLREEPDGCPDGRWPSAA